MLRLLLIFSFSLSALELSIEEAINRGLTENRRLLNSRSAITQAKLQLNNAKSAFAFKSAPKIQGGMVGGGSAGSNPAAGFGYTMQKQFAMGTYVRVEPSVYVSEGMFRNHDRIIRGERKYDVNVNTQIRQPLFRGFNSEYNLAHVRSSEYQLRSAARRIYISEVNLIIQIVSAAYRVTSAHIRLNLTEKSYERLSKATEVARTKERIGLADAMDVYRAEMEFKQAEEDLHLSQEQLSEAQDALKEILALPLDEELHVHTPMEVDLVRMDEGEAVEIAMENRVELDQADDTYLDYLRKVHNAEHALWPQLDVVLNYSAHASDQVLKRAFSHLNVNTWGVGLQAGGDLDRSVKRNSKKQAELLLEAAERQKEIVQETTMLEVKRALRTLQQAEKRMQVQKEKLRSAEGRLKFSELKFERGMGNNFEVISAEKSLHAAALAESYAITEYIVGSYRLRQALGVLVDRPERWE